MQYIRNGLYGAYAISDAQLSFYREELLNTDMGASPVTTEDFTDRIDVLRYREFVTDDGIPTELILGQCKCPDHHPDGDLYGFFHGQPMSSAVSDLAHALNWFDESSKADPLHPDHHEWTEKQNFLEESLQTLDSIAVVDVNGDDDIAAIMRAMLGYQD